MDTSVHQVATLTPPVSGRDHAQGPATAPLTLVEYGDYECPYCGEAYSIVKLVQSRMRSTMRFVFRNFPLADTHPHATLVAQAAEAAASQGMFWQMHDRLFEHQRELSATDLVRHGAIVGLDVPRFARELSAQIYDARVREDFQSGAKSGVSTTPAFFINGHRHDGPWDAETLVQALLAAVRVSTYP